MSNQLGQLLVIGFDGTEVNTAVRGLLARIRPAGVILFSRNLVDLAQTKQLTADLHSLAAELGIAPLLIGIDHEGGAIVRMGSPVTPFCGNLALAATDSLDLAKRQAEAMAEELLALGFNWNFAPCVDVNSNPRNPIIGARSFGDDPARASAFGAAMIDGFQSQGIIACAKHFPGHGDTEVDSHLGLPRVSRPLESLREIELPPFRAAIAREVASLMTAHILFPALDAKYPATASAPIITDLLREELGFDGVIVSDALEMAGFAESIGVGEGAVACVNAGVDLLLVCAPGPSVDETLGSLQQAFASGRLELDKVAKARERVKRLKNRFLTDTPALSLSKVGCQEHQELQSEIATASITLLRDEQHRLPISGASLRISAAGIEESALTPLRQALAKKCALTADPAEAKVNLLVTDNLHRRPELVPGLREMPRSILLAVGYPGDADLLPGARTALACYSSRPASLLAAAAVLLGEAPAPGRLPLATRQ